MGQEEHESREGHMKNMRLADLGETRVVVAVPEEKEGAAVQKNLVQEETWKKGRGEFLSEGKKPYQRRQEKTLIGLREV